MKITFKDLEDQTEYLMQKAIDIFKVKEDFFPEEFKVIKFGIIKKLASESHLLESSYAQLLIQVDTKFGKDTQRWCIDTEDLIKKDVKYYKVFKRERQKKLIPKYEKEIEKLSEKIENLEPDLKRLISFVKKHARLNSIDEMLEESNKAKEINNKINRIRREIKDKKEHINKLI